MADDIEEARKKILARTQKKEAMASIEGVKQPELKKLAEVPKPLEQARPGREEKGEKITVADFQKLFTKRVLRSFPNLSKDLIRAEIRMDPARFISRALTVSLAVTAVFAIVGFMLAPSFGISLAFVILLAPVEYFVTFLWLMKQPRVKILQRERELDRDILFAGRDMLIALKAGVPLFNAMANISRNYGRASVEFSKIVERVQGGTPAELALQESADMNTSKAFRRIILQVVTSMRSGSDVASAIEVVLGQISQEQIIALKRYGQTLNPLTMFYMLFGIILPSLGIAIGIILTSFVSVKLDFGVLLIILIVLTMLQYLFLALIRSSRPQFEI